MPMLQGAALMSVVNAILAQVFPPKGSVIKLTDALGRPLRGRPRSNSFADFCNKTNAWQSDALRVAFTGRIDLVAGLWDAMAAGRRELTATERKYLAASRDAEAMGTFNDEPFQSDVYVTGPLVVDVEAGETIGQAFARAARVLAPSMQAWAEYYGRTLYLIPLQNCIERNARSMQLAKTYGCPSSLVFFPSRYTGRWLITDTDKEYEGRLPVAATAQPQTEKGLALQRKRERACAAGNPVPVRPR